MTLFKQIVIIIAFFQTIMFGVIMWQNFNTVNVFVQTQLKINAKHTANSLGLSITPAASNNDVVLIETMISSMFDSGYYELISLTNTKGKTLVKSYQKPAIADVPQWFVQFINLSAPTVSSDIMAGWSQYGKLHVKGNIGAAYEQLWMTFEDIATTFLLITMLSFLVLYLSLKFILKPLVRVQEQAEAIVQNDFIFQKDLPLTKELKQVVVAMNSMVKKVKDIFEQEADSVRKYHEVLYRDEDTKLFNRRYFALNLQERLKSEDDSTGSVVFCTLANQKDLKMDIGYEKSKLFYENIGKTILSIKNDDKKRILSRMKDSDFAFLLPNVLPMRAKLMCENLQVKLSQEIENIGLSKDKYVFSFGIVNYSEEMKATDIFSKADFALASSKSKVDSHIFVHEGEEGSTLGKGAWKDEIESAMRERRFVFATQRSIDINNEIFHHELFLRLKDKSGNIKSAGYFMPMINELNLFDRIDRYVLDEAKTILKSMPKTPLSINIGKDIMLNTSSLSWFEKSLDEIATVCESKVSFETFASNDVSVELLGSFSKMLRKRGFDFGLDNFSFDGDSLKILQDINPSYIKIQNSIILDLLEGESGDVTKQSLKIITESMDIKVIASGIENENEKQRLEKLGIQYLQGSLIEKPTLLDKNLE